MSTPVKIASFVVAIAAVFGVAFTVGHAIGPTERPEEHEMQADEMQPASHGDSHGDSTDGHGVHGTPAAAAPAGLAATQDGYTLTLAADRARPGTQTPLTFTITGPDGHAVTDYDVQHEKRLHLIVVRRDATGFQHVHPELAADGTWSTDVDLTPGPWRVYADFTPTSGEAMTLAADLLVSGDFEAAAPRADTRTATVDGYTVTLDGDLAAGSDTVLTPRVSLGGRDVTGELEPYLGALGHLVALRRSDLAYLHVHPEGLDFHTNVPTAGTYELFLDFKLGGVVRTAALTLTAAPSTAPSTPSTMGGGHAH
jgi:hypothetical protein